MVRREFLGLSGFVLAAAATPGLSIPLASREDDVRIGIIGTGQRGTGLASIIQKVPGLSLVAGADVLDFRLKNCMDKYGAKGSKSFSDYRALLADPSIDAVIISTPLSHHYQMVLDALEAGKHVYCEKTMAFDIEQSLSIAKKVKSNPSLTFQVGYQYRSFPLYHEVKKVIDEGWLGELKYFETFYNRNNNWRREVPDPSLERQINWRMYREFSGGLMAELSSHQVDVVNWMLNSRPESIRGIGGINFWKDGRETYDHINLVARYPNDITGQITSHIANAHMGYTVKIMGTDGTVEINFNKAHFYKEAVSYNTEKGIVDGVSGATKKIEPGKPVSIPVEIKEGYSATTYALESFADCIREGKTPNSEIKGGTNASIMVAMANKAMQENTIENWKDSYSI